MNEKKEENLIIVLLTSPRSGSTWLFDMLRSHPLVYMNKYYDYYERLGVKGHRRYPVDLSGHDNFSQKVEVLPGKWESIPKLQFDFEKEFNGKCANIEKIHPHFFNYNVSSFLNLVSSFSTKKDVQFIYQVRNPKEVIISFLEYIKRNPQWGEKRRPQKIPIHINKTYDTIAKIEKELSGRVVKYENLKKKMGDSLKKISKSILNCELNDEDIDLIERKTKRKERLNKSEFVGKKRSEDKLDNYEDFLEKHTNVIEDINKKYESL